MSTRLPDKMILHRMGYYSNQEGIARRYIQEDDNWNIHLSNTRRFILNIVRKERPETVTVLGSGWLLDIPMQEILRTGCRVRLVDLIHPPGVVHKLGGETSVSFEHEDITGGLLEMVWMMASGKPVPDTDQILQRIAALRYEPPVNPGLVLSVNLLSQLTTLPFEFLQKKKILKAGFMKKTFPGLSPRQMQDGPNTAGISVFLTPSLIFISAVQQKTSARTTGFIR